MSDPSIAIIQSSPVFLNLPATIIKTKELTVDAAALGADIVVFPETWLPGYPVWLDYAKELAMWGNDGAKALYRILYDNSIELNDQHCASLQAMADEVGVIISLGAHERVGRTLYNTMMFFSPNAEQPYIHRKFVPTYTEKLLWGQGDGSTFGVVESKWGNISGLICWEHWMPLARAALHEMNEIIHIAQWPEVHKAHLIASQHYAFEGRCFVAASGMVLTKGQMLEGLDSLGTNEAAAKEMLSSIDGGNDRVLKNGGSAIIGPDAEFISEPVYDKDTILIATLPLAEAKEQLMTLDVSGHYARPDVFELTLNTKANINVKKI